MSEIHKKPRSITIDTTQKPRNITIDITLKPRISTNTDTKTEQDITINLTISSYFQEVPEVQRSSEPEGKPFDPITLF